MTPSEPSIPRSLSQPLPPTLKMQIELPYLGRRKKPDRFCPQHQGVPTVKYSGLATVSEGEAVDTETSGENPKPSRFLRNPTPLFPAKWGAELKPRLRVRRSRTEAVLLCLRPGRVSAAQTQRRGG